MKEIELFINEEGEWLDRISLVDEPAIETDFMAFAKEHLMFSIDNDKHIITGPVMIPEKRMWRNNFGGCYVYFSAETIKEAAYRWLIENRNHSFNLDHKNDTYSVSIIESWITEDTEKDKSTALGFTDIPKGTWFVSAKVDNDELWSKIKSGEFNGFSIEGTFILGEFEKQHNKYEQDVIKEAEEFLKDF